MPWHALTHPPNRSVGKVLPELAPVPIEQYRKLAFALHRSTKGDRGRVLLVTSALAGEGKSLTAVNLVLTLSGSYRHRVLIVDADFRRPAVSETLAMERRRDDVDQPEAVRRAAAELNVNVWPLSDRLVSVIPNDAQGSDPIPALNSPEMRTLIDWGRDCFDWVILDSPPATLVPDATILAPLADGTLLVVQAARTPSDAVQRAVASIGHDRIVGVVMNRVPPHATGTELSYYDRYGGYYYDDRRRRR